MSDIDMNSLLEGLEQFSSLITVAAGYRAKCIEAGFSPEAAEEMAVDLHATILHGGREGQA